MALILAGVWLAAGCTGATRGEMVVEWWGKADCARHKGMKIEMSHYADGVHGLWFDLSELKRGTRVYHASLRVHTKVEKLRTDKRAYMSIGQGVFYYDPLRLYAEYRPDRPIEIFVVTGLAEEKRPLYERTEPLKLEAPQFKSFDVTDAVRGWVSGDLVNRGLLINRLARWDADKTVLEVRYAGSVKDPPPQASGIKAAHRKGQTFLTWTEAERIIDKEEIRWKEFETTFKKYGPRKGRFYRIYRHEEPITARNLHQAERIDEIRPLSGYDARMHQHVVRGENWIGLDPEVVVPRYVIEDPPAGALKPTGTYAGKPQWWGKQLALHTGLYVHQVKQPGKGYYAVTTCMNGVENTRDITAANSLAEPLEETVAPGEPILYRWLKQDTGPRRRRTLREAQFFVYWAAPPYANQPRRPIHVIVALTGAEPGAKMRTRYNMRNMYGNEIVRGVHAREWRSDDRLLTILCDASYMTKGYYDSWNTLKPKRAPSRRVAYSERMGKLLEPWALKLTRRAPPEPPAK